MSGDNLDGKAAALEGELLGSSEAPPADGAPPGADGFGEGMDFDIDPQELVADTLELLGETFAPYWLSPEVPEDIRITRPKIEKLSKGYVMLALKYIPGMIEKYPLEFMVLVQTAAVLRPILKAGVPLRKPKPRPVVDDAPLPA